MTLSVGCSLTTEFATQRRWKAGVRTGLASDREVPFVHGAARTGQLLGAISYDAVRDSCLPFEVDRYIRRGTSGRCTPRPSDSTGPHPANERLILRTGAKLVEAKTLT